MWKIQHHSCEINDQFGAKLKMLSQSDRHAVTQGLQL